MVVMCLTYLNNFGCVLCVYVCMQFRMFVYAGFGIGASLGGFTAITELIAALNHVVSVLNALLQSVSHSCRPSFYRPSF
jgi:hypothetical protein